MKLDKEQLEKLALMLAGDEPFSKIRKELNLNKNYNIKTLCEYHGKKFIKLYESHVNNLKNKKQEINTINTNTLLTKEDFIKGMSLITENLKNEFEVKNIKLLESKNCDINCDTKNSDIVDIIELPKLKHDRLQRGNKSKQISIRVIENIIDEFKDFTKDIEGYNATELYSLALLEFVEKYRTK